MRHPTRIIAATALLAGILSHANAATPLMWGVDEDDGQLFSIADYDTAPVFTDYGNLKWDNGGTNFDVGFDIEAVTLTPDGTLLMALNEDLGGFTGAVLLAFDIADASTSSDNVVDLIGTIGPGGPFVGSISGLSIDPTSGALVGLIKRRDGGDDPTIDELFVMTDPLNDPSMITSLGNLTDGTDIVNGEDLEFSEDGLLFVSGADDSDGGMDQLYEVKLIRDGDENLTGITDIVPLHDLDGAAADGGFNTDVKFEALGWDFENNTLIGSSDDGDFFADLGDPRVEPLIYSVAGLGTLGAPVNELKDVEGIDFVPLGKGPPPPMSGVPEPATLLLLGLGLAGLSFRRRNVH